MFDVMRGAGESVPGDLVLSTAEVSYLSSCLQVAMNETAIFRCSAETDPRRDVSIEWLFNGKRLDLEADPRLLVQEDGSLVITRAILLDTGIYTCLARTRLDNDSAEATLVVQGTTPRPLYIRTVQVKSVAKEKCMLLCDIGESVAAYYVTLTTE